MQTAFPLFRDIYEDVNARLVFAVGSADKGSSGQGCFG